MLSEGAARDAWTDSAANQFGASQSAQNPLSKAGWEQARVLSGGHNGQAMGMRAQIGAQPGAFRNSEGAVARPDTVTCQDGGDRYDKKTNENGKLTAHVRKINNSTIT